MEHGADVFDLYLDAGDEMAHYRHRRHGEDGSAKSREGEIALRRDRSKQRILRRACATGGAFDDECFVPLAERGTDDEVCGGGRKARNDRFEGASLGRRDSGVDL